MPTIMLPQAGLVTEQPAGDGVGVGGTVTVGVTVIVGVGVGVYVAVAVGVGLEQAPRLLVSTLLSEKPWLCPPTTTAVCTAGRRTVAASAK